MKKLNRKITNAESLEAVAHTNALKEKRGITLVALVVTIVVLLILAGVSLNLVLGNNGIITKSQDAKVMSRAGSVDDEVGLWKGNNWIAKNSNGSSESENDMLQRLIDKKLITTDDEIDTTNKIIRIKKKDGTVVKEIPYGEDAKTLVEAFKNGELKVGDYINYAPTYTNTSTVNESIGNGWRVAYINITSGIVTLISEGVPLEIDWFNDYNSSTQKINLNYGEINNLFDNSVADNIDIPTLEDFQLLCNQAGYEITHTEAGVGSPNWTNEAYLIDNDSLGILDVARRYIVNTVGIDGYGDQSYFSYFSYSSGFETGYKEGYFGVRLVVDLKSDLLYYGGTGTQGDPYQIY